MKTLFEHIEHVKTKPHHVRRQVALTVAFGISAVIAGAWMIGVVSLGTFAIQPTSFAANTAQTSTVTTVPAGNADLLAGAAASQTDTSGPAHIEIISTATSSTLSNTQKPEQTVIPF